MSCFESPSSDEVLGAEYDAWLDEMNRDMREPSEFSLGPRLNVADADDINF
jgi:hypothetical protein